MNTPNVKCPSCGSDDSRGRGGPIPHIECRRCGRSYRKPDTVRPAMPFDTKQADDDYDLLLQVYADPEWRKALQKHSA